MDRTLALKKVKAYVKNPELIKEPSMGEMADLVVLVLNAVQQIETAIKEHRLDGKTPQKDVEYLGKETALKLITKGVNDALVRVDSVLNSKAEEVDAQVRESLQRIRDGNDGIVTEEEIQRAADLALGMLELPDFDALVSTQITSNGDAIRDALELLSGENRYKVEIADVQGLEKALNDLATIRSSGGTIGKQQVYNFIRQAIADGTITGGGASTFLALTDTPSTYTGQAGKYVKVNATEDELEFDTPAGTGIVETIVAGTGITVDDTDPANPIINATPTAGGITEELAIAYAVSL